jgi:hypothetical protein
MPVHWEVSGGYSVTRNPPKPYPITQLVRDLEMQHYRLHL